MVLTAQKAANDKNVVRNSIAAGHKLKGSSSTLEMTVVVERSIGKKKD